MSMDRRLYPPGWRKMSDRIRFGRAKGCCEWCGAEHGQLHPRTGSVVVLTTAHLGTSFPDGTPGDKRDKRDVRAENLAALCQACHLDFDRADNIAAAKLNRERRRLVSEPTLPGFYALAAASAGNDEVRSLRVGILHRQSRRENPLRCPRCGHHPDEHIPPWLDCPAATPAVALLEEIAEPQLAYER